MPGSAAELAAVLLREQEAERRRQRRGCGSWQDDYARLHRATLSGHEGAGSGFLIFYCETDVPSHPKSCGGFGDRLVGMVSALLLAVLTRRALIICNPGLDKMIEPVEVDWRWDALPAPRPSLEGWITAPRINSKSYGPDAGVVNLWQFGSGNSAQLFYNLFDSMKDKRYLVFMANHGLTAKLLLEESPWRQQIRELGLTLPNIFACLTRFLLQVRPENLKPHENVARELADPLTFSIGIHIRAGFHAESGHSRPFDLPEGPSNKAAAARKVALLEHFNDLLDCAQRLEDFWAGPELRTRWFIMSDTWEMKQAARDIWGDKILVTDVRAMHIEAKVDAAAKEQGTREVAAEWELFSRCQYFVFVDSGLSKTAAAKAQRPTSIFTRGFGRVTELDWWCSPAHNFSSVQEIAQTWSLL
eukprot:SM000001S04752  [mRNA]  locus=s1:2064020:2066332:+ [translate_table: standard]